MWPKSPAHGRGLARYFTRLYYFGVVAAYRFRVEVQAITSTVRGDFGAFEYINLSLKHFLHGMSECYFCQENMKT